MIVPLPVFVAVPLATAFLLPIFGKKGKAAATVLANLATISLLVLAIASIGQSRVYEIGRWSIPLGINLVLDGLRLRRCSSAQDIWSNTPPKQNT